MAQERLAKLATMTDAAPPPPAYLTFTSPAAAADAARWGAAPLSPFVFGEPSTPLNFYRVVFDEPKIGITAKIGGFGGIFFVDEVKPGQEAERKGIKKGDVIQSFIESGQKTPVTGTYRTIAELQHAMLTKIRPLTIEFSRVGPPPDAAQQVAAPPPPAAAAQQVAAPPPPPPPAAPRRVAPMINIQQLAAVATTLSFGQKKEDARLFAFLSNSGRIGDNNGIKQLKTAIEAKQAAIPQLAGLSYEKIAIIMLQETISRFARQIQNEETPFTPRELKRLEYFSTDGFINNFVKYKLPFQDILNKPGEKIIRASYTQWFNQIFASTKKDWRSLVAGIPNETQCLVALDQKKQGRPADQRNEMQERGNIPCWICGRNILPKASGVNTMQCEHVLGIASGLSHWALVQEGRAIGDPVVRDFLSKEYDWSCQCCNQIKSNWEFIRLCGRTKKYIFNTELVKDLLRKIQSSASYDCPVMTSKNSAIDVDARAIAIQRRTQVLIEVINYNLEEAGTLELYDVYTKFKLFAMLTDRNLRKIILGDEPVQEELPPRPPFPQEVNAVVVAAEANVAAVAARYSTPEKEAVLKDYLEKRGIESVLAERPDVLPRPPELVRRKVEGGSKRKTTRKTRRIKGGTSPEDERMAQWLVEYTSKFDSSSGDNWETYLRIVIEKLLSEEQCGDEEPAAPAPAPAAPPTSFMVEPPPPPGMVGIVHAFFQAIGKSLPGELAGEPRFWEELREVERETGSLTIENTGQKLYFLGNKLSAQGNVPFGTFILRSIGAMPAQAPAQLPASVAMGYALQSGAPPPQYASPALPYDPVQVVRDNALFSGDPARPILPEYRATPLGFAQPAPSSALFGGPAVAQASTSGTGFKFPSLFAQPAPPPTSSALFGGPAVAQRPPTAHLTRSLLPPNTETGFKFPGRVEEPAQRLDESGVGVGFQSYPSWPGRKVDPRVQEDLDRQLESYQKNESCVICTQKLWDVAAQRENGEPRQLPCRHWFHGKCIAFWETRSSSCPICRKDIRTGLPQVAEKPREPGLKEGQSALLSGVLPRAGNRKKTQKKSSKGKRTRRNKKSKK